MTGFTVVSNCTGFIFCSFHLLEIQLFTILAFIDFKLVLIEKSCSLVYLQILGNVYTGLMQAAGASEKVFEYIDREPEIKNDGTLAPKGLKGQIEFKNVSFHYPSRPDTPVLKVCNECLRFLV